jgi:hypothetical protein
MEAASDFLTKIRLTFHQNTGNVLLLLGYVPFDPRFGLPTGRQAG